MAEKLWVVLCGVLVVIVCTQIAFSATKMSDGSIVLSADEVQSLEHVFNQMLERIRVLETRGKNCL